MSGDEIETSIKAKNLSLKVSIQVETSNSPKGPVQLEENPLGLEKFME